MKEQLKEIIEHYGVMKQLKYFQSEVFELNEAIINREDYLTYSSEIEPYSIAMLDKHIAEEIADIEVMLNQFKEYYGITYEQILVIMQHKINRQLERIKNEGNDEDRKCS